MMKQLTKYLFLIITFIFSLNLSAQNLILNEDYLTAAENDSLTILTVDSSATDSIQTALLDTNSTSTETSKLFIYKDSTTYGQWQIPELDLTFIPLSDTFFFQKEPEVTPEKTYEEIIFKIHVLDTTTGENMKSNIFMTTIGTNGKRHNGAGITTENGEFEIKVRPDSHFDININSVGYFSSMEEINVVDETIKDGVIERTYKMRKLQKGDLVNLKNVQFHQNDYQLTRESLIQLERLVALLKGSPKMVIRLEGHTDITAGKESSIRLSQKRVYEVRYYLVRRGINHNRIKAVGYGNTKPITHKKDPESQKLNRRVEFRVLKI